MRATFMMLLALASTALFADQAGAGVPVAQARDPLEVRRGSAEVASGAIIDKTRDAAITAEIQSRLARDPALSTLRIDIDSSGGNVVLRGLAPDAAARDRATMLARGVEGVLRVSNELQLRR
jgi:hyperosmotically inducible protein